MLRNVRMLIETNPIAINLCPNLILAPNDLGCIASQDETTKLTQVEPSMMADEYDFSRAGYVRRYGPMNTAAVCKQFHGHRYEAPMPT